MTLNQIIDDIMLTCYYIDKEKSEKLLRRQVEAWVHQYRLLLLKQEISKNSIIDPGYISYQTFDFNGLETSEHIDQYFFERDITRQSACLYLSIQDVPELAPLIGRYGITSTIIYGSIRESVPNPTPPPANINVDTYSVDFRPATVGDISRTMYSQYDLWNGEVQNYIVSIYNKTKLLLCSKYSIPEYDVPDRKSKKLGAHAKCGLILATPSAMKQGIDQPDFKEQEYPIPMDRIPRLKQMIFSAELQWLIPPQGTAQSSQMAKVEEQELMNNPAAMLQVGADVMDGMQ